MIRQTVHIFKKDARHLRWEIALELVLLAAFAYSDARLTRTNNLLRLLTPIAWFILIARLIQSEALPGDKQFWLTKPYSKPSLLASKILFLLVFITLPLMAADAAIVSVQGFPVLAHIPGLIWMQLLWWTQFILPIVVLASTTPNLTAIVFWAVVIIAAGSSSLTLDLADPLGSLEWIGNSIYLSLDTAAAVVILIWQYARRRTSGARIAFGCTLALGSMAPILPLSGVLPLREPASVTVGVDPQRRPFSSEGPVAGMVQLNFPLQFTGVPEGLTARPDVASARIDKAGGGTIWRSNSEYRSSLREEGDHYRLEILVNQKFFERVKNEPVRIRSWLLFTLFGDRKTVTLPPQQKAISVPEVGLCDTDLPFPFCRAPFRGPRVRVQISWDREAKVRNSGTVYTPSSPFPAELGMSPMWASFHIYNPPSVPQPLPVNITLTTEEPKTHLRRVLTLDNIRLADY